MKRHDDAERTEARWRTIVARAEADGLCLLGQGAVTAKRARGRIVWVLRYRVGLGAKTVHKSIYLGADEGGRLRQRVRELLERYRHQGRWLKQLPALVRLAAKLSALGRQHATRSGAQNTQ
jgi:hypothetical protein